MSSTTITRGNVHESFVIAPSLTPTNFTTSSVNSLQTFAIPGLQTTDIVQMLGVSGASQTSGVVVQEAFVSAANTLSVQFANVTGSLTTSVVPAIGTYNIQVIRPENNPLPTNAA